MTGKKADESGRGLVGGNVLRLRKSIEIEVIDRKGRTRTKPLSQEVLAERAGVGRQYLSDVERGLRNITIDNIVALANALDVAPWELLRPLPEDDGAVG